LAIDHGNPDLFGLGSVNQHLFHNKFQLATQLGGAEAVSTSCTCDLATYGEISYRGALGLPVCWLHCLPRVCGGLTRNLHRAILCRGFLFVCHVALEQPLGLEGLAR
jgi:hypothetical protein